MKAKRANKSEMSKYKELEANLGTKVLAKKTDLDKKIQSLEMENIKKYGTLPSKSVNCTYSNLLKAKKLATTILRNIGIKF